MPGRTTKRNEPTPLLRRGTVELPAAQHLQDEGDGCEFPDD